MSYSSREVAAMLGISTAQIRAFASKGFLSPERGPRGELRFGFHDLILLRTAGELIAAKIPERKIRRALEKLREQLPEGKALTAVRIAADGERIVVRDGDQMWRPESGQSLFDFSITDLTEKFSPVASVADAEAEKLQLAAEDWYELGCDLEITSAEEAQKAYEKALELDPEHVDAHVNLGRLFHERRAPAAAEKHYRTALALDPEHATAAFNLGVALEDLGRIADALDAYRRAIDLDAENADAHYNIAGLYEKRGDKAAALRHLKAYARFREG